MKRVALAVVLVYIGGLCQLAAARPVKMWSYEELLKEADVVVVATGAGSKDLVVLTDAKPETWVLMQTTFKPVAVLKGKVEGGALAVEHYRYASKEGEVSVIDGPVFVKFDITGKTTYLLFLKRNEQGILKPVTGQTDPIYSVRILSAYQSPQDEAAK